TELELFPTVTPGQDDDGEEDSDDDAGGGDPADDDTSGDGPADDDAPGGGPADDDAPGSGPADDGPSDGEATGKDSSHGDPADDDSAPGADTGDGADRTGATGDEATGHSGGLATTGTEAAPLALLVLALLGWGSCWCGARRAGPLDSSDLDSGPEAKELPPSGLLGARGVSEQIIEHLEGSLGLRWPKAREGLNT